MRLSFVHDTLTVLLLAMATIQHCQIAQAHDEHDSQGATALVIVDVQDCFMEAAGTTSGSDGTLPVADTAAIIPLLNELRQTKSCLFDNVVRSQDYHPDGHISFGPTHGLEPFAHLAGKGELPLMCIAPSSGLESNASCCPSFHIEPYDCNATLCPVVESMDGRVLEATACSLCKDTPEDCFETTQAMWTQHCLQQGDSIFPPTLYTEDTDVVVQKGGNTYADSYSAFMDNTKRLKTELDSVLSSNGVTKIYLAGIATDYCVYFSAIDALALGYEVELILDLTRGISAEGVAAALADMESKGVTVVNASDVMAKECPMEGDDDESGAWTNSLLDTTSMIATAFLSVGLSFLMTLYNTN